MLGLLAAMEPRAGYAMINRIAGAALIGTLLAGAASAQIADPEQRMYWFNLQRLTAEAAGIEACNLRSLPNRSYDPQPYYRAAGEAAVAIEAYIQRYPEQGRWKNESPEAYRYRIWQTAILAGQEKGRSGKQLTDFDCHLLLHGR
jgi:hypothetical protein